MRDDPILGLLIVFVPLSLLSIGGGPSILAGIQNAVEARHWMSQHDFVDLFAIARAAPGPGVPRSGGPKSRAGPRLFGTFGPCFGGGLRLRWSHDADGAR